MDKEKIDITDIEDEILETKVEDSKIKIDKGLHKYSIRAKKHKRLDRVTLDELNVALEYFDYRCAYTGQQFVMFDEKVGGYKKNLSVDHIIALVSGGHNIAQNMIPSVLQYNVLKNGYHLLDWYKRQETASGEKIYNPYRLLKIYNYMAKSLSAIDLKEEEYRQAILSKNEIDNYLETKKEQIYSDDITTYEEDDDGTKLLQKISSINGSVAHLEEEQNIEFSNIGLSGFMNNMLLELENNIDKEILEKARGIFEKLSNREKIFERIPKEEKAQAEVIEYLKTLGCESSYTIARTIDISKMIEYDVSAEEYLKLKIEKIQKYLNDSKIQSLSIGEILDNIPQIIESDNISEAFVALSLEIPEYIKEVQRLDVDVKEKSIQNINTALQIVNEYNFEESIERKIVDEEKKILLESILNPAVLNSGSDKNTCYLSTLYKNLTDRGMKVQEAYGAIINYAIGVNVGYSYAIGSANKIQEDLKTQLSIENITYMLMCNGTTSVAYKKEMKELGIDVSEKHVHNVNTALKIVNEYDFEKSIGRKITNEEKKVLIESILNPNQLNKDATCRLSTLYKSLIEKGMNLNEAYGAIINYAIGINGGYVRTIGNTKMIPEKDKIKIQLNMEDITYMLMLNETISPAYQKELEKLGIEVSEKRAQNVNAALQIVNEYGFEESIGRKITNEEKKVLIESILNPASLNSDKKYYLAKLYKNFIEKGMDTKSAYGAIMNYAIGSNGNYANAIGSVKKIPEKDKLKIEITEESVEKIKIKAEKKAKKTMKSTVNKDSITRIEETMTFLEEIAIGNQKIEYQI